MLRVRYMDADGDGTYSTSDAAIFLRAAAGIVDTSNTLQYDVDNDGAVSLVDAQKALRIVSGIEPVLTQEEALELFNKKINTVKSVRPGFEKESTVVCPSIKVTTMNAPISSLNVTDLEFDKYVQNLESTFGPFANAELKAQLADMKAQAKKAYEPQVTTKTVTQRSNAHYSYFPVNNLGWSSKLTIDDVSSVTCAVSGGNITYTISMGSITYVGDEYPTGTAGFSKRQSLSYGKAFNIPAFDESDGSTVNKVTFKDGRIVFKEDLKTGDSLSADYYYTYEVDVTGATQEESSLVMKTKTLTNVTEKHTMNRVTVE